MTRRAIITGPDIGPMRDADTGRQIRHSPRSSTVRKRARKKVKGARPMHMRRL